MQFAPRQKKCVAASRFRLSHSPEKLHANDSNIFAKFFRSIFENISRCTLSRTPCGKCSIFCTDAGNYTHLKYFRRCPENISQKCLSRLGGVFQENDSSEIGKPPHNFFPVEQIASNSRFLLRLREISWVTPSGLGQRTRRLTLGLFSSSYAFTSSRRV